MSAEGWAVAEDRTSPNTPSASSTTHLGLLSSRTQSRAPKPLPDCQHPTAFPTSSVLSFITLWCFQLCLLVVGTPWGLTL